MKLQVLSRVCIALFLIFSVFLPGRAYCQGTANQTLSGTVVTDTGEAVPAVQVSGEAGGQRQTVMTDAEGRFRLELPAGDAQLEVTGAYLLPITRTIAASRRSEVVTITVRYAIGTVRRSLVVTAPALEPELERRNDAVFRNSLFSRDDQIFDVLASGINAGQHEGGGKSIELRRFGYNLDHGGVGGGLSLLIDNVQQNQQTQGHGQGYLGSLKSLTPELVDEVEILNGPFSAQYGDFSGLGVVHIRLKERLPDRFTMRLQGGSFDALRTFLAWSPRREDVDSFLAYEGAGTNGPFVHPLHYRRDNLTGNYRWHRSAHELVGIKLNLARNRFDSSGQIPLEEVAAGRLDRFGALDPFSGGKVSSGTAAANYTREWARGDSLQADGFVSRSLFDLWSNFTFFLQDPVRGDEIQQHDSRLIEGANAQWRHPWRLLGHNSLLTVGSNFHDNQILLGLFRTQARQIYTTSSLAHAHVTNQAVYLQQGTDLMGGRMHLEAGLRYDYFRFEVRDQIAPGDSAYGAGEAQPKANLAFQPSLRFPLVLHANYGRAISSQDARGVVQYPNGPRLATTDFYQFGTSHKLGRASLATDWFLIDRSHEQVYVPDDGSTELTGPSRAYGFELKSSLQLTSRLSWNAGVTQVSNAFYRGTQPREYVARAPHTVANAGLTLAGWHGTFASLRYRHVSGYRLDELDPGIRGRGLNVVDLAVTKLVRHGVEVNFAVDNLTNDRYYETQNYLASRVAPLAPVVSQIHATPGYPVGFTAGVTLRLE